MNSLEVVIAQILNNEVFLITQPDEAHDINHCIEVTNNAKKCFASLGLSEDEENDILVSCMLHDVDDKKVIRGRWESDYWTKYVLEKIEYKRQEIVLDIINLVSCSKWGDRFDYSKPLYYYITRYCDRLEAIGEIGVSRCISYNKEVMVKESTLRANSLQSLIEIASPERYELYSTGKVLSGSVIEHCYDKLLHINLPSSFNDIPFLKNEFESRHNYIVEFVLSYWSSC